MVHPAPYLMTQPLSGQPGPSQRHRSEQIEPSAGDSTPSQLGQRASSPLLRRLNGRPQACDPCRSRKVSCDHTQPVCRRCEKRGDRCVYTISDQTSQASARKSGPSTSTRSRKQTARVLRATSPTPGRSDVRDRHNQERNHGVNSSSHQDEAVSSSHAGTPPERPTPRIRHLLPFGEGYLGFTSYSNVFDEARNSLSLLNSGYPQVPQVPEEAPIPTTNAPTPASASSSHRHLPAPDPLPPATRDVTLHVLRSLPNVCSPDLKHPARRKPTQLWALVSIERIMATLRRRYGSILGPNRTDEQLERMAREICTNSAKPFDSDLADPDAFLDQFAGDDLRWESLGLLFTFREYAPDVNGSGASSAPATTGWEKKISRQLWGEPARQCLRLCLVLSKTFSDGNSIIMYLCIKQMVVDSLVYGDASLDCWLSHGAATAVATFLGLHALPEYSASYKPSLASELKRRFFANIFTLDKVGSSFHGRPPLLGHRYATSPIPLDLPDEALIAGGEELDKAVASLDENGWAKTGLMESSSLARCRMVIASIKDELMEIALGNLKSASIAVITEIKEREQKMFNSFPPWCKYQDDNVNDLNLSIDILFCRLLLQLEHLQANLIAERLISRYNGPDDGSLLFISFEMVRHVLVLWMHIDRFDGGWGGPRVDFLWMVMSFGAPGGGVLCMELLYPTLPNRPIPYTSPSSPRITRSAIIQQLSLLVGFLGWVAPTAPTTEHTTNCRRVIQSVLDYTLNNTNPPVAPGQQGMDGIGFWDGLETGELDIGFDMLGTFDWFRPDETVSGFN